MKILTTEQMRQLERQADAGGYSFAAMMENAGRAVATEIMYRYDVIGRRVLALVGPGNNGGDGLVAARYLHDAGAQVTVYLAKRRDPGADINLRLVEDRGVKFLLAEKDASCTALSAALEEADLVIDALLGTGVSRPVEGVVREILWKLTDGRETANRQSAIANRKSVLVAVDLPSGLNADTGSVDPVTPHADLTVTFACPKRGHFLFPGAEYLGELAIADIGIPAELAQDIPLNLTTAAEVRALLPRRPLGANKGTFGKVLVMAGSVNYPGAACLATMAALRVGAGLVTLACAASLHPIFAAKMLEVTYLPLPEDEAGHLGMKALPGLQEAWGIAGGNPGKGGGTQGKAGYTALLLGPGLGQHPGTVQLVQEMAASLQALPPDRHREASPLGGIRRTGESSSESGAWICQSRPSHVVIDADGLNAMASLSEWWKHLPPNCILTPHPGEMGRLAKLSVAEIEANRWQAAAEKAREWGQVVILKGAYTVIAAPDGRVNVNPFANPGLATAGSGDVLAGVIAGLLAQGMPPFEAAVAGTYLHGLAGEMAKREIGAAGMIAGDLLPLLPRALRRPLHHPSFVLE